VTKPSPHPAVYLERLIPASPAEVYDAWLSPEVLRLWLAPGSIEITNAEVDKRVGGHYRIWHSAEGSSAGGFECEITEMISNQLIVFRWGFVGPARTNGPVYDSLLKIHLEEASEGVTRLILVHERLEELASALPQVAEQVKGGWESVLTKLAALFKHHRRFPNA
jgi:uncharacterized protein YndB with AHSA1/START domain